MSGSERGENTPNKFHFKRENDESTLPALRNMRTRLLEWKDNIPRNKCSPDQLALR